MKQIIFAALLFLSITAQAQVGIGTATPNSSAQLDISSADKGLLIPRMTGAEVAAIASPATGLMVFQTDNTPGFYYYDGSAWKPLHTGLLPIANGGTGDSVKNFVDLTTNQSVAGNKSFSADIVVGGQIQAGTGYSSGNQNTVFGNGSHSGSTASNNTALGFFTLNSITTGNDNTAVGTNAMRFTTNGNYNTAVGAPAAQFTTGSGNTAIGHSALSTNTSGDHNTAVGYQADVFYDSLNNATAIGYGAKVNEDNTIQLGNANVTSLKTSGQLTTGTITFPNIDGTSGQVLTTDGSGNVAWNNTSAIDLTGILPVAKGGTGLSALPAGNILFGNGTNALHKSDSLFWDNTNSRLGILTTSPSTTFQIGVETGIAAENLKWGVMNGFNTLQLGYRQTGWKLKAGNNSGVITDLIFANTDGTNDVDRMTVSQYGVTMADPLNAQTSVTSPQANFTNLDVNSGRIYYNSSDDKVGILTGSPASSFQVFGDGNFDNPMKYDNGGSTGTLKFGFRGKEFRLTNTTNSGVLVNLAFSYFNGTTDVPSMNIDYSGIVDIGKLKAGGVSFPTSDGTSGQVLTTNGSGTAAWTDGLPKEVADEPTPTASQTNFTLTHAPSATSKVKMYINGIRISNTAYSVTGTTLTYTPANNGAYLVTVSDRIQFDYYY